MEKNPKWKGGRRVDSDGYVLVKAWDHPKHRKNGYVLEHRLVMERHLGRLLEDWEVVHHKNCDKTDNRIENLELLDGQASHMKLERTGKKYPRANRAIFTCETCRSEFSRSACWKNKTVRWCSWGCRYACQPI
jgi:hypothetical protein